MKKITCFIFASLLVMSGCSKEDTKTVEGKDNHQHHHAEQNNEVKKEQKVTIEVTKDKKAKTLQSKEVEVKDGDNLMAVMEKNFKIETAYKGSFITSIDGITANEKEKYAWMFSVNGKPATKGAKDIIIKPGDLVDFDLQKWQ